MKISVVTPSVRKNMLSIVEECLSRQTLGSFEDYEWLVISPKDYGYGHWIEDPPKKDGDFYALNKAWNKAFSKAEGELVISIVDGIWFPPNTLEWLWNHYQINPTACISLTGNQYDKLVDGKPENMVWQDPRIKGKSFYEIPPWDLELCVASLPLKGIKEVGGVDEEFDKFPAWSEKDLACRMARNGYSCFIDESIQYRAIHHPRLNGSKWDEKYPESTAYFEKCFNEIQKGKRLKLDFCKD